MPNEKHLEIILQGVDVWNSRRESDFTETPNLAEAKLGAAHLSQANLYQADLGNADLSGADLSGADLRDTNITRAELGNVNLSYANLRRADLFMTNLSRAGLSRANLSRAILYKANLAGADLSGADLSGANLIGADLSGANLSRANLNRADLRGADLSGADLRKASIIRTTLRETGLRGADLSEAEVGWGIFGNIDLSETQGLDTVRHLGPSTIGTDTLYRSQGKIPRIFLQGAGVPDNLIAYVDSLTVRSLSCFLLHSTRDRQFAEQLYADLQTHGVRCWLAPEEADIEDKIRPRIDASIRVHGNVLLILSKHSVNCMWMEEEAQTAFEVEGKRKETVLFPVRLDQSVMDADRPWAASIRGTRPICDFTGWEDPNVYQKALLELLENLRPGE